MISKISITVGSGKKAKTFSSVAAARKFAKATGGNLTVTAN